jgi:poly-beta-1,6-N-acetyl-D-glucosamine synthase
MDASGVLRDAVQAVVLGCLAFLVIGLAMFFAWAVLAALERRRWTTGSRVENYPLLESSRFTIPVSVVVPAQNEETVILTVVRALLAFQYPTFEVIVVNDGSTDGTLQTLVREFALQRREVFCRRVLPSRDVQAVYRSAYEPRLLVVDKLNGGKADSLNCGINFARYRYLCCLDGDTTYEPDALLKGMRLAMKDPARVIAVTSHFAPSSHPESMLASNGAPVANGHWLVSFQELEYLRSFLITRLAWSRGNYMLNTAGAFMIYRRDVMEELGGFSPAFTCEDIELTFRAHERYRREKRPYRILSLPDTVGHTEVPMRLGPLISQRSRWQRVIMETTWHYRRMFANPRYGLVGLVGVPYYALYEAMAPFVECVALAMLLLAAPLGVLSWQHFGLLLGAVVVANGILTNVCLLLRDDLSGRYRIRDWLRLVLLGPLELVIYRPVLLYARCLGAWQFFRGDKSWERFDRNPR